MCDPLTIASGAAIAGSTLMNHMAQQDAANARDDALRAERIRQSRLDREADALNLQSQDRYQDFEGQQEERRQDLSEFLSEQRSPQATDGSLVPESRSNITVQEEGRQRDAAREFTDRNAENLANLRSFGDLLGGIQRGQSRDAGYIGQVGGFKQGWSNVLPLELQEAQTRGGNWKLFGDVLGGLGSVGMTAASADGLEGMTSTDGWGELFGSGAGQVASGPPRRLGPHAAMPSAATNGPRLPSLY